MMIVAFLAGGIAGLLAAGMTLLFTDLGWVMALAAFFGVGYAVPLAVLAASWLTRPIRAALPRADMVRR